MGHNADSEAILRRRRFLVESAIAGLGVPALLAGCGEDEPRVCLSIVKPKPKTDTPAPPKVTTETPPKVCLSVAPEPAPCLSMPAPKEAPKVKSNLEPCLSVRIIEDK